MNAPGIGDGDTITVTSYLGTKMYNMRGEEEEVVFDAPKPGRIPV